MSECKSKNQTVSNEVLGHRIKALRLERGKSLQDVADQVRVQNSTIHRYEVGTVVRPKIPVVNAIAEALHVSPDYLFGVGAFEHWSEIIADLPGFMTALGDAEKYAWAYDTVPGDSRNVDLSDLRDFLGHFVAKVDPPTKTTPWAVTYRADALKTEKTPDNFVDVESLSEDKQYLINKIMSLTDEEVQGLRAIVDQVLALRGK